MVRLLKQLINNEKGQALAIVLGLLALGGLTIAASLNYATTNLKGSGIIEEKTEGVYAAGAGVKYAYWALATGEWSIASDDTLTTELSENISGMSVSMETLNRGVFTLSAGELTDIGDTPPSHWDWIDVDGEAVFDGVTTYTANVTWQGDGGQTRKLVEFGVTLPAGYVYEDGSAADFVGNMDVDEPTSSGDTLGGAQWLRWLWAGAQRPVISENTTPLTQQFRITGSGSLDGDYAWIQTLANDIGLVGEITGTRYTITATATRPEDGRTTAEIVAGVVIVGGDIQILSWQITN